MKMDQTKLDRILELHKLWLSGKPEGERANLGGANLSGANLRGADLRWADFCWADFRGADLRGADLRGADLRGANLRGANLSGANLRGADLRWADFRGADLRGADLRGADLRGADLRGAKYDHCRGNNTTIKTIHCDTYDIAYTDAVLQIGCERHEIEDWWKFSDAAIRQMDGRRALDWWKIWKPILRKIIKYSPAESTGFKEQSK